MARINLSIPDELKARMDACGESVNWSQVAATAFEERLEELAGASRAGLPDEIASALRQAPGVAVETLGKLLGAQLPHLEHAFARGLRPVVDRLASLSASAAPSPEAAIDELRAKLGAEVILLRLELLERRERRRAHREARRGRMGLADCGPDGDHRRRHRRRRRGGGDDPADDEPTGDEPLSPA